MEGRYHSVAWFAVQGYVPSVDLECKKGLQAAVSLRNDDYRRTCPEAEFADKHIISYPWLFAYLG